MKKDNLEHYLSEAAKIRELGVSVEAVLVHLMTRSDMTVHHTADVAISLEQHRPALLQLLDEADGDGWMRLHRERELIWKTMSHVRYPPRTLTVVIRDVAPRAILDEPVAHRSVSIQLTEEQLGKLALRKTGTSCGTEIYEEVSFVFFDSEELTVAFVAKEETP